MHVGQAIFPLQNYSYFNNNQKSSKQQTSFDYVLVLRDVGLRPLWPLSPVGVYTGETRPASLWPLQPPCTSQATASLLLLMCCSYGIRSGPGKLTALRPGLYHSRWVCKPFIYHIKEWKEPQAMPLLFCIKWEDRRLQSYDSETLTAAIIPLEHGELTKQIKQRVSSRG